MGLECEVEIFILNKIMRLIFNFGNIGLKIVKMFKGVWLVKGVKKVFKGIIVFVMSYGMIILVILKLVM